MVFVNGRFAPTLSEMGNLPKGLEVCALARALDCGAGGWAPEGCAPEGIEQHLGRYADVRRDVFAALNTALWEDGAYLRIRRGAVIEQPIHLLYVSAGAGSEIMTHPRTLVVAEEASQAAVIEDYVSIGSDAAFSNAVTELAAGQNAVVSHYLIERENLAAFNVSTLRMEQARGTNIASHSILLGGGLVRNNVHPVLAGEGAECLINGLFVGAGKQHLDNYMMVEHAQPLGAAASFTTAFSTDTARGVFHGRIVVHKDAQKTDAKQTNRNLLLERRCAHRHQAAAGDSRRRREVHARRDDRADRGRAALLSARARARRNSGAEPAALCLCRGVPGPHAGAGGARVCGEADSREATELADSEIRDSCDGGAKKAQNWEEVG